MIGNLSGVNKIYLVVGYTDMQRMLETEKEDRIGNDRSLFCPDRNAPDRPGDARIDAVLLPLAKRAIREKSALMTYRGNAHLSERNDF